jgi:hypothetical protein
MPTTGTSGPPGPSRLRSIGRTLVETRSQPVALAAGDLHPGVAERQVQAHEEVICGKRRDVEADSAAEALR